MKLYYESCKTRILSSFVTFQNSVFCPLKWDDDDDRHRRVDQVLLHSLFICRKRESFFSLYSKIICKNCTTRVSRAWKIEKHANIHSPSFTGGGFNGGPNSSGLGPGLAVFNDLLGIGRITGEAFKLTEANKAGCVCCPRGCCWGCVELGDWKCVVVCSQAAKCLVVVVVAPGADAELPPGGDDPKFGLENAYWRTKGSSADIPAAWPPIPPPLLLLLLLMPLLALSIWMVLNQLVGQALPLSSTANGGRGSPPADMPSTLLCSDLWIVWFQSCMASVLYPFLMARIHFPFVGTS